MRRFQPTATPIIFSRIFFVGLILGVMSSKGNNALMPHQLLSTNNPPASPANFSPDPNPVQLPEPPATDFRWVHQVVIVTNSLTQPHFNPDPGASVKPETNLPAPLFNEPSAPPQFTPPTVPAGMELPRENSRLGEILPPPNPSPRSFGDEPLPDAQKLPRENVRRELRVDKEWRVEPRLRQFAYPSNTVPVPDRWRIGFSP